MALAAATVRGGESQATNLDNTILALVLTESYADGGYAVVYPKAAFQLMEVQPEEVKRSLKHFPNRRDTNDVVNSLVDRLFERNRLSGTRKAVQFSLPSSPTNGYVLDYDAKYGKYFKNDGGGWPQFYKENPKAHGIITVSLPAHDEQSGLVLIYRGISQHGLQGKGELILYKLEKGQLSQIDRVVLWIA